MFQALVDRTSLCAPHPWSRGTTRPADRPISSAVRANLWPPHPEVDSVIGGVTAWIALGVHCDSFHRGRARFSKLYSGLGPMPIRTMLDNSRGASRWSRARHFAPNHPAPPSPPDDLGRSHCCARVFCVTCCGRRNTSGVQPNLRADTKRAAAFFQDLTPPRTS